MNVLWTCEDIFKAHWSYQQKKTVNAVANDVTSASIPAIYCI